MTSHDEHTDHDEHREITIETLSTPPVYVKPAPLQRRIAAGTIDSILLSAVWAFATFAMRKQLPATWTALPELSSYAYLAALTFAYYFIMEGLFAATIGKFMLKIRVVGIDGEPCSFAASFRRNLIRFVDWLPLFYLFGGVFAVASSKRQRLGDRFAGTIVSPAPERDINPPPAPFLFH